MPVIGPLIAVVDDDGDSIVVWWVDPSVGADARLCGAWTVDRTDAETVDRLVFGRTVLATPQGAAVMDRLGVRGAASLDAHATLAAVIADCDWLRATFAEEQASRSASKKLREPRWPTFPEPLDLVRPPLRPHVEPDPQVRRALGIAHWLGGLCDRWADLENERLSRPVLRSLAGETERPVPVVVT